MIPVAILALWFVYSWKIGLALAIVCFVPALFYSASIPGGADEKMKKTFTAILIAMSLLMVGVINQSPEDPDQPKMCGRVEC